MSDSLRPMPLDVPKDPRTERLIDLLGSLSREAAAYADMLGTTTSDNREIAVGWGIMALNGWMQDIREQVAKGRHR